MNNKGQIFSIDLILAMVVVIIFIGAIISISEIRTNQVKNEQDNSIFNNKTQTAFSILLNGKYSCKTSNGTLLTGSLDRSSFSSYTKEQVKNYLGLSEENVLILFDGVNSQVNDSIMGDNFSFEENVLLCDGEINYSDLNDCMGGGTCSLQKKNVLMRVAK
jgi:hypothetical protein